MSNWHLKQAARVVRAGGIIAYPTEGVFGLGCDPLNLDAVLRLLQIKQRPIRLGLILIASRFEHLRPYINTVTPTMQKKLNAAWPGPVTWLLPVREEVPRLLRGDHDSIAVRITAHPLAAALCETMGEALVSTSANLRGHPPARNALAVRRIFDANIDYVLAGETGGRNQPTEIRDARTGKVIRPA